MNVDRPANMSVKEWIIKMMSLDMRISSMVITEVVNHQFIQAGEAMKTCDSLEFSGFGKFYFNKKKARKMLESLKARQEIFRKRIYNMELSERQRKNAELFLGDVEANIELLKAKLHED